MSIPAKLEGWVPTIDGEVTIEKVVDLAFEYRGNCTVVRSDGRRTEGYIFNRNARAAVPHIDLYPVDGATPVRIPYLEIENIWFTGRDTAAAER